MTNSLDAVYPYLPDQSDPICKSLQLGILRPTTNPSTKMLVNTLLFNYPYRLNNNKYNYFSLGENTTVNSLHDDLLHMPVYSLTDRIADGSPLQVGVCTGAKLMSVDDIPNACYFEIEIDSGMPHPPTKDLIVSVAINVHSLIPHPTPNLDVCRVINITKLTLHHRDK